MRQKPRTPRKKFARFGPQVRRKCRFCKNDIDAIDYKDIKTLERFLNDRGKINSRRMSGNCAKHQRLVVSKLKKARFIALLPYVK